MKEKTTPKKIKENMLRALFSLIVLCISFTASFAQKKSTKATTVSPDEQRKLSYASSRTNVSAAFSDAVKTEAETNPPTLQKTVGLKPATAMKRKAVEIAPTDAPTKPKNN